MWWWVRLAAVVGIFLPALGGADDAAGRGGMQVHVDPQTGHLVSEPATPPALGHLPAPAVPAAELPASGGGMMSVVGGQFRSEAVATVEPDGRVRVECIRREPPPSAPR